MSQDINKLGKEALDRIDVAEEYITKVSRVATAAQKQLATEIAKTAREKVESAIQDAKKISNSRTIKLKDRFDTSDVNINRQDEVIENSVAQLLNFVDKYTTKEEVVVIPEERLVIVPGAGGPALAAAQAQVLALQGDVAARDAQILALQGQVAAKDAQILALQGDIVRLQARITRLNNSIGVGRVPDPASYRGQIAVKDAQIAVLQNDIAVRELELAGDGTPANPGLRAQKLALDAQVAALQGQVAALQGQIAALQGQIAAKDAQIDALNKQINGDPAAGIVGLIRQIADLTAIIGDAAGGLTKNINDLNATIAVKDAQINNLNVDNLRLAAEKKQAEDERNQANIDKAAAQAALAAGNPAIAAQIAQLTADKNQAVFEKKQAEDRIGDGVGPGLQKDLNDAQAALALAQAALAQMTQERDDAKAEEAKAKAEEAKAKAEEAKAKAEEAKVKADKVLVDQQVADLTRDKNALELQIDDGNGGGLLKEKNDAVTALGVAQNQLNQAQIDLAQAVQDKTDADTAKALAEAEAQRLDAEKKQLSADLIAEKLKLAQAQADLAKVTQEKDKALNDNIKLQQKIQEIETDIINLYKIIIRALSPGHTEVKSNDIKDVINDIAAIVGNYKPGIGNIAQVQQLYITMQNEIKDAEDEMKKSITVSPSEAAKREVLDKYAAIKKKFHQTANLIAIPLREDTTEQEIVLARDKYKDRKDSNEVVMYETLDTYLLITQIINDFRRGVSITDLRNVLAMKEIEVVTNKFKEIAADPTAVLTENDLTTALDNLNNVTKGIKNRIDNEINKFANDLEKMNDRLLANVNARISFQGELHDLYDIVDKQRAEQIVYIDKCIVVLDDIKTLSENKDVVGVLSSVLGVDTVKNDSIATKLAIESASRKYNIEFNKFGKITSDVNDKQKDVDEKTAELTKAKTKVSTETDEKEKTKAEADVVTKTEAKTKAEADLQKLRKDQTDAFANVIKEKNAVYDAKLDHTKKFIGVIPKVLDKLQKEKNNALSDNVLLRQNVADLTNKVNDLNTKLTNEIAEKNVALADVQAKIAQIQTLTQDLQAMTGLKNALQLQVDTHDANAAANVLVQAAEAKATADIAAKQVELDRMRQELADAKANAAAEIKQAKEGEDEASRSNADLTRANELLTKKADKVTALEKQIEELKQNLENAKKAAVTDELNKAHHELELQLEENLKLSEQLDKLIEDTKVSDNDYADAKAKIELNYFKMEADYESMRKIYDGLDKDATKFYEDLRKEIAEKDVELAKLKKEFDDLKADAVSDKTIQFEQSKKISELESEKKQLDQKMNELKQAHTVAESKMQEELKKKVAELAKADADKSADLANIGKVRENAEKEKQVLNEQIKKLQTTLDGYKELNEARMNYLKALVGKSSDAAGNEIPGIYTVLHNIAASTRDKQIRELDARKTAASDVYQKAKTAAENKIKNEEKVVGSSEHRRGYYGGNVHDDSLNYTAVGVAGVAGTFAWFGFGGLLVFLLVMLIIWFAHQIYKEQFDKNTIYHKTKRTHRMVI